MHINLINSNIPTYQTNCVATDKNLNNVVKTSNCAINRQNSSVPFTSTATNPQKTGIRTEFVSKEEQQKYLAVASSVDNETRKNLDFLVKNGKLLSSASNDNSTVLDNLYNILANPRAAGLNPANVLTETINIVANPYRITQQFGDIPQEYVADILSSATNQTSSNKNLLEKFSENKKAKTEINAQSINVKNSGACVAASIEFNLAQKMPAEFTRFAERLSSPNLSVNKKINMSILSDNTLDGIWLLNAFNVAYKMDNFDNAEVVLKPDKNAIIRARIQDKYKDANERSLVDVLMQSTFMNLGSQNTYNTLTDTREGKFNQNNKGLIEFEKTFAESVVEDKNMVSVTYQIIDENDRLIGYETTLDTMKKHILETLQRNENVIIGYTQVDGTNKVINGHEITIIGAEQDSNGKTYFLCNDTDDDKSAPIKYSEDYLLPKIHHAGLPYDIAEKDVVFVENWVEGLKNYRENLKA